MTSKKILFILVMITTGWLTTHAQTQDRWSIGPKGGVNFSNVTNVEESQSVTGLVLGLATTYSFNENTGLSLEALYSVEGYKAPFTEAHLRYLQVPLYFDYFFGKLGDRLRPKVYAGIVPGFFLGGSLNNLDVNKDYYNKFMFAISGGFGANYRLANRVWLNADLRSYIGMSDIRSKDNQTGDSVNSRNIQITLGVMYGLSKLN
jgi:outer membrane protein W